MTEVPQHIIQRAEKAGVQFETTPAHHVVITGLSQMTPLGDTESTWQRLLTGDSAVRNIPIKYSPVKIASMLPEDYNPYTHMGHTRETPPLGISRIAAMSIATTREALSMAGLLSDEGRLDNDVANPHRTASWISSGVSATPLFIEVSRQLGENLKASKWMHLVLQVFPEQLNSQTAMAFGFKGPGGNDSEACATSAANVVEGYHLIKSGRADVVIAGGFEYALEVYPEETIKVFSQLGALSSRNDSPKEASRPFDKDRDGFVTGSGGGVVVLESSTHAERRNARIYAEVMGAQKSMDAHKTTELDPDNIAYTVAQTLYSAIERDLLIPHVVFAHATATIKGDPLEMDVLRNVFSREELDAMRITAIKSVVGHLMGGAGVVNIIAAVQALRDQQVPPIRNLDNPDPKVEDMNFVRGTIYQAPMRRALTMAYGFGGNNAIVAVQTWR